MSVTIPELPIEIDDYAASKLDDYAEHLLEYNSRINLMSRKSTLVDVENHISHCLSMAQRRFNPGSRVVDWGSGGGLPAIPLSIVFPDIEIVAVDTIGKKVKAIRHFIDVLELPNVQVWQGRAEAYPKKFHYSVSRATASLSKLWAWHVRGRIPADNQEGCWKPGLLTLKGGDLISEIRNLRKGAAWTVIEQIPIPLIGGVPAESKYLLSVNDDR